MPAYTARTPRQDQDPLPPGNYKVKVIAAKELTSKASGNPMIEMTLLEKESRNYITDRLVFTEKASFRIDQFLAATGTAVEAGKEIALEPDDCLNRVGWVKLDVEEHNGRTKNVVKFWLLEEPKPAAQGPQKVAPPAKQSPKKDDLADSEIPFN